MSNPAAAAFRPSQGLALLVAPLLCGILDLVRAAVVGFPLGEIFGYLTPPGKVRVFRVARLSFIADPVNMSSAVPLGQGGSMRTYSPPGDTQANSPTASFSGLRPAMSTR